MVARADARRKSVYQDPPIAKFFFNDSRAAWIWLIVRLYVGYGWIVAGIEKVGNPAWVKTGAAVKGYWTFVLKAKTQGAHPEMPYGWYQSFLQYLLDNGWWGFFGKLVAFGELLVGIALVLGALTAIAAFFGTLMNFSYLMAGTASTNPVLFGLAVFLILAWKIAGYWGVDRWLLPALGTPWKRGMVSQHEREDTT
ncbi:MAG: DoxX family protein [Nitrospinota bacterium]